MHTPNHATGKLASHHLVSSPSYTSIAKPFKATPPLLKKQAIRRLAALLQFLTYTGYCPSFPQPPLLTINLSRNHWILNALTTCNLINSRENYDETILLSCTSHQDNKSGQCSPSHLIYVKRSVKDTIRHTESKYQVNTNQFRKHNTLNIKL